MGLSLCTAHLAAMYGTKTHRFFDPNVFYTDEEMRKVITLLAGGFLFSGQEKPSGSKNGLREDLLKKFATGEGIAGRLPFAILTKLICIRGWKRIECNKLIKFDDVEETNFESILRRCAVINILARFFDKACMQKICPAFDSETYGISTRDPDAEDLLSSAPCVLAGLQIQHAFCMRAFRGSL